MKIPFLVLIMIMSAVSLVAQEVYTVSVARGEAFKNNILVKVGDRLYANDKIIFKTRQTLLVLLNKKGRFMISLANKPGHANELTRILVKDNIRLHASNQRLSSRTEKDYLGVSDYFETDRKINSKILVVDELKIYAGNVGVTIDNLENLFVLQLLNNTGGMNRKLNVKNDTLVIKAEDFTFNDQVYSVDKGIVSLVLVVGYSKEKKVKRIADISPEFLSRSNLLQIMKAIISTVPHLKREDVFNEIYTQLYYFYGKPDRQMLAALFDSIH